MADNDELHVNYAGFRTVSGARSPAVLREADVWTELYFEYSAPIILRSS